MPQSHLFTLPIKKPRAHPRKSCPANGFDSCFFTPQNNSVKDCLVDTQTSWKLFHCQRAVLIFFLSRCLWLFQDVDVVLQDVDQSFKHSSNFWLSDQIEDQEQGWLLGKGVEEHGVPVFHFLTNSRWGSAASSSDQLPLKLSAHAEADCYMLAAAEKKIVPGGCVDQMGIKPTQPHLRLG